jgi:AraC-like DNA-binding protein
LVILSGKGRLVVDRGPEIELRAPCVICAVPGRTYRYAPESTWEELFLKYPAGSVGTAKKLGLFVEDRHSWPIRSLGSIKRALDDVLELLEEPDARGQADRMDRAAERLIAETLIGEAEVARDAVHKRVLGAKAWLEAHAVEDVPIPALARRFGFAESTFRRAWAKYVPESPSRFVAGLRIRQACRMLCETGRSVTEISQELGYADVYTFSKAFRAHVGETARDYRKRFSGRVESDGPSQGPVLRERRRR